MKWTTRSGKTILSVLAVTALLTLACMSQAVPSKYKDIGTEGGDVQTFVDTTSGDSGH